MTHIVEGLQHIKVDNINLAPVVELGADEVEKLHQPRHTVMYGSLGSFGTREHASLVLMYT